MDVVVAVDVVGDEQLRRRLRDDVVPRPPLDCVLEHVPSVFDASLLAAAFEHVLSSMPVLHGAAVAHSKEDCGSVVADPETLGDAHQWPSTAVPVTYYRFDFDDQSALVESFAESGSRVAVLVVVADTKLHPLDSNLEPLGLGHCATEMTKQKALVRRQGY